LREAVAHQRTQLQEAKAIIKQQGKELRDKDGEFEALKERLTGVDHPGALLAALIPADELQELMDKMDGKGPAMVGARRGRLPGVNHTCDNGYVKPRFLSDEKEQWAELLQSEYGLQQSWLVLKPIATAIGTGGAASTGIGGMKVVGLKEVLLQLGRFRHEGAQGRARSPAGGGQTRGGGSAGRAAVARFNGHFSLVYGWGMARGCFLTP
jgi:hypothetical protein